MRQKSPRVAFEPGASARERRRQVFILYNKQILRFITIIVIYTASLQIIYTSLRVVTRLFASRSTRRLRENASRFYAAAPRDLFWRLLLHLSEPHVHSKTAVKSMP